MSKNVNNDVSMNPPITSAKETRKIENGEREWHLFCQAGFLFSVFRSKNGPSATNHH